MPMDGAQHTGSENAHKRALRALIRSARIVTPHADLQNGVYSEIGCLMVWR